ncbi:ABC transporter permease [Nitratireductor pacificus]|uniref:Oligopeptide transport system permease protein AppC n=1 Tax=Nitratireductor pacificus pht-3B TaxID=391937 RepID=K2M8X5_9HYPH|nr:ABC transporter permease [Nitratireductor pacificus]EKF18581.1 oligopeptide transport system permease protein AppC [Nitratireductor pacificus pht-3B]
MQTSSTSVSQGLTARRRVLRRLLRDRSFIIAFAVILILVLTAVLNPLIIHLIGHGPNEPFRETGLTAGGVPLPPGGDFLLGTDVVGRDLLARLVAGTRVTVFVAVSCAMLSISLGVVVGLFAGYRGGIVDAMLSGFIDVVLGLPFLVTAIALVSVYGASFPVMMGTIVFFTWGPIARIVRNLVVSAKENEFVDAARMLGAGDLHIMFREILPNIAGQVVVYGSLLIPQVIVLEASLSFLGLGVPPPTATWGGIIAENQTNYAVAWWSILFPSLALLMATLAFNIVGDGLRDALDPSARSRGGA